MKTNLGLFCAMTALVTVVVLLHATELPVRGLGREASQLAAISSGQRLGTLFAALLGALSITTEFRHGTIRPIFLVTPQRGQVIAAKVLVSMLLGTLFGLSASAVAAGVGSGALTARGVVIRLDGADYALLLAGSAAGAMLWSAIGTGLGAVAKNQVATLVGITTWLLFVEGLLFGDIGLSDYGRLLPGALATAAAGLNSQTLLAPGLALVLLSLYALAAAIGGWVATTRRDVA